MHKTSTVAPSGPGYAPITCSTTLELLWHGQANASLVLTTGDLDIWYCIGLDGGF